MKPLFDTMLGLFMIGFGAGCVRFGFFVLETTWKKPAPTPSQQEQYWRSQAGYWEIRSKGWEEHSHSWQLLSEMFQESIKERDKIIEDRDKIIEERGDLIREALKKLGLDGGIPNGREEAPVAGDKTTPDSSK